MAVSKVIKTIINTLINVMIGIIFFVPFYWAIITSIKSLGQVLQFPPSFYVVHPHLENFRKAYTSIPFLKYTINSCIVTFGILVCQLFTVIPAAYAFASYNFKGKKILFSLTMITMMIPGQLIFLPIFLLFSKWGIVNSYWTLILPFASSAFGIFMLRQSFMQVPKEIIEAARIDKANELQIIYKIMLPMVKSTVATLTLFIFISSWNDYFWPLVMTTTDAVRTLPVGIVSLQTVDSGITSHIVMAGNLMMIIPIIIAFVLAQKQIINAFTFTGDK